MVKSHRRRYLVLSDIHLGARTTPADFILRNLTTYFGDFKANSQFADLDVIFIAGDLWDDTLTVSSSALREFIAWFAWFIRFCAQQNIAVRILEGTPRHDRRQGLAVEALVSALKVDVDFRYVAALSIEHLERLDMTVLYVPDECRTTAEAVQRDVQGLLDEHNLDKVDIAIMHGMFKFQLGTIPMNAKVHDEVWYLDHVRHYINIGHVHSMRVYSRILGQGSFDRHGHGEEEAKGGMLIEETATGEWAHFFIENPHAKIYRTIDVTGSVDVALSKIDREVRKLPQGSYVRIRGDVQHPVFQGFDTLRTTYPLVTFSSKKITQGEDEVKALTAIGNPDYIPVVLNRETLTEAIFSEVQLRHDLSPDQGKRLFTLLEDLHV